jgi:lactoylglutathione lyase
LQAGRKQPADDSRHVGLVVDDKEAARAARFTTGNFADNTSRSLNASD